MPVDDVLLEAEDHMQKAIDHLHHELGGLRTGRASPSLVENVRVDYYGTPTSLRSLANITVPEATQLLVRPFDKGTLKAIEKAINDSKLGVSAQSDGQQLRINLPAMSTDRRKQLAGQCKEHGEAAKIKIRGARRDGNKQLDAEDKAGDIAEDEAKRGKTEVDDLTKKMEASVEEYVKKKQDEIMQV